MDVTSCLKHLAKYWDVYWFVAEEPRTKAEIKEYLMEEHNRAYREETTPSCREKCSGCGATSFGGGVCFE